MKTPYGKECKYYYADYYRGRETQECRLIGNNPASDRWFPALCQTCPVPGLLLVNRCPHLHLYGRVSKAFFGLSKQVQVEAFCDQYFTEVQEPRIGCGHCHEFKFEVQT